MNPGGVPLTVRLGHEIPKPKDWQAFQRGCVILFKEELNDPTVQGFGRNGQVQGGIDLLGRRDDRADHFVAVQCRLIAKRDKPEKVLSDCRAALKLGLDLKELIFATTAPDDVRATTTAHNVEKLLRAEGHDLKVTIYGWGALQELIARHPEAYFLFFPAAAASFVGVAQSPARIDADQLAATVARHLGLMGVTGVTREVGTRDLTDEDPRLHARIDAYRNLFKDDGETLAAERRLLAMLDHEDLTSKPWARFRIETNLGAIAIDTGRELEAASRFEKAHALRPDDPNAVARLALARTIQGRHAEAINIAREVLQGEEPPEYVVGFLLQAAARSGWQGNPEDLIPDNLRGTPAADLGLAEFLRLRDAPGWAMRSLDLASKHLEVPEFRRVRGLATLEVLVSSDAIIPGVRAPLDQESIQRGADDLKAAAEHCLAVRYATGNDLVAHLSNAGAMLRLAGRYAECEALLRQGVERIPDEPHVRRQLALAQAAQGRREVALKTLGQDADPENVLLIAELTSPEDPRKALAVANRLDPSSLEPNLVRMWSRMVGDLALRVGDGAALSVAVARLRSIRPGDFTADLLEIAWDARSGDNIDEVRDRLRAVAASLPDDATAVDRYFVAARLREHDLPDEAASLLEARIDFDQGGPAANLYLQCLSASRRDAAFRRAVATIGSTTEDVDLLWTIAVHAWNVGDLAEAERATRTIRNLDPNNEKARQLRIEVLIRQNRIDELLGELDGPVETLQSSSLRERSRIASLLAHFGHVRRGAALAYRLYLENRGESQAWMGLAGIILDAGRADADAPRAWEMTQVAEDAAVDVLFDDGGTEFCIVEPDATLRRLDNEAWEPEHALIQAMMGLTAKERFVDPSGREGTVTQVRHKFVARFHQILANHQKRFPEVNGFRRIDVDPSRSDWLDQVVKQLKERSDWFDDEQRSYLNGPWPLSVLAVRLGVDTIEAAGSLVAAGHTLKVSNGSMEERIAASQAIGFNGRRGCVMDLLCFWTAWDLKAIDVVTALCGPVSLPQGVVDRLRARRDQIVASVNGGLRSAGLVAGKLVVQEAPPDLVQAWLDDLDRALRWIEEHATVEPVIVDDGLNVGMREYLRLGQGDVLDALVVARHGGLLLLTDDGPTRDLGASIGFTTSTWLNHLFTIAFARGQLGRETWIRWSAALIGGGHQYMGVSGAALATAAILDAKDEVSPGPIFNRLLRCIGGKVAEPASHVQAAVSCLREIWQRHDTLAFREQVTSLLLRQLTRERADHPALLRWVVDGVTDIPNLTDYIRAWSRGHFLRIA